MYLGSSLLATSTSAPLTETIQPIPSSTTTAVTPSPAQAFQSFTVRVAVTSLGSIALSDQSCGPSCAVTITVAHTNGGIAASNTVGLMPNGSATATYTLPAGTYQVGATFSGNSTFAASSGAAATETVTPAITTLGLSASPVTLTPGQSTQLALTLTASASSQVPPATILIYDGASQVASATLVGSVQGNVTTATIPVASLSTGTHLLTASFAGTADFLPARSSPVAVTVLSSDFRLSLAEPTLPLRSGDQGSADVMLMSLGAFTDSLDLSCSGLPQYGSFTFSLTPVMLASGVTTTVTVQVNTAVSQASSVGPPRFPFRGRGRVLVCVLPGVLLLGISGRRRIRLCLWGVALCVTLGVSGCGSRRTARTPPGTYFVMITAHGRASNQGHAVVLTLVVTP